MDLENVKYLLVEAEVRYWEDTRVNGEYDTKEGDNIPCKENLFWKPIIELDSGKIINWIKGKTAHIHYKVADQGTYFLLDEEKKEIYKYKDCYVPDILCPEEDGYGDYIIFTVDKEGFIKNWKNNIIKGDWIS